MIFLNRFFWPDHAPTGQLLADLARHVVDSGYDVTVVASKHHGPDGGVTAPDAPEVKLRSVASSTLGLPRIYGRAAEYATFGIAAAAHLWAEVRRGDTLVVKTDPPLSCVLGWFVTRAKGAKLVNWCQDLFPEVAAALGLRFATGPTGWAMRRLRTAAMRAAWLNVAISEGMAERMRQQGLSAENIRVVPNWADGTAIHPVRHADNPLRRAWGLEDRFVIGYSGNFGRSHDPAPVLDLMCRVADRGDLAFLLIGGGTAYEHLRKAVDKAGLRNVLFLPYQPQECLAESLSAIDLHIVTLRPSCEGLAFPSKVYAALAVGRPMLFIGNTGGEVARLLSATGSGLSVDGADVDELVRVVERLRAEADGRGARARAAFEEGCAKEVALARWTAHLAAVASAEPSRALGTGDLIRRPTGELPIRGQDDRAP